jgi:hypothetical protein
VVKHEEEGAVEWKLEKVLFQTKWNEVVFSLKIVEVLMFCETKTIFLNETEVIVLELQNRRKKCENIQNQSDGR